MTRLKWSSALAGLTLLAAPGVAVAAEEIDLTIAASHPTTIPWVGMMQSVLMPEVDRILAETGNYEINWQEAFGGQLYGANATLSSVEQGITDIGWVFSYLEAPKMPLSQVAAYTPFSTNNVPVLLDTMTDLMDEVPAFREEWERYNLVFLGATGSDSYDLYTKEPIDSVDDLAGMRLSAPGVLAVWLRGLDATAVDGALTTFYTDIQTGVSDGAVTLALGAWPAKIYEVAPYITRVNIGVVFSGGVAINRDTWDGLPEEVQEALRQAGEAYTAEHARDLMERHETALQQMVELGADQNPPVTVVEFPAEERQAWIDRLPNLAAEWVEENEARGLPAGDFLRAYMGRLRENGETPARAWDEGL